MGRLERIAWHYPRSQCESVDRPTMFSRKIAKSAICSKLLIRDRIIKKFGFIVVLVPVITIALLLLINLRKPWEFDESYNLQIVQNLRQGNGYATNGAFRGSGPYLFDPYISTGPAVLVPIWVVSTIIRNTLLAARLVMFSYFLFMLGLLYQLTPRSNYGRFTYGLMLMVILPIIIFTNPLFVLGETSAATLFLLATVSLKRGKTTLAGVALAAVILCKLNFVIAALMFLLFELFRIALDQRNNAKGCFCKAMRLIFGFVSPLLVFEIYRLISLGSLISYRSNIQELRDFVDSQRLEHWSSNPELLGRKLTSIINIPGLSVWVAVAFCIASFLSVIKFNQTDKKSVNSENHLTFTPVIFSGLAIFGTFLFLSSAQWERQAASAFYLALPLLVLATLNRLRFLIVGSSRRIRVIGVLIILLISVPLGVGTLTIFGNSVKTIRTNNFGSELNFQRHVAKLIRDSGATSIGLDGWFQNPDYQLLSGVPAASMPNRGQKPIIVVSVIKYYFSGTYDDFLSQKDLCREVVYSSKSLLVCWPKNS